MSDLPSPYGHRLVLHLRDSNAGEGFNRLDGNLVPTPCSVAAWAAPAPVLGASCVAALAIGGVV